MTYDGLTPDDVATQRFTPVRGGREGYDMKEVDTYLDEVERSLILLNEAHTTVAGELSRAEIRLSDATNRMSVIDQELVALKETSAREIEEAHAQRERALSEATERLEDAQRISADAGIEVIEVRTVAETSVAAARLLHHASATADATTAEAEETKARLINEANEHSEKLIKESEANFLRVEAELNSTRTEILNEIASEKERLDGEVNALKEFERTIRGDLNLYLTQIQEKINEPFSAEPVYAPEPVYVPATEYDELSQPFDSVSEDSIVDEKQSHDPEVNDKSTEASEVASTEN